MSTVTWGTFDLDKALAGTRVGFKQSADLNDTSWTGLIDKSIKETEDGVSTEKYRVKIGSYTMFISNTGKVLSCSPTILGIVGQTMEIVEMVLDNIPGTEQTRTSTPVSGYNNVADLTTMNPQDYFAVEVLGIILRNVDRPERVDDANMRFYCDAAYRWANAMKISAANARKGTAQTPGTGTAQTPGTGAVTVNQGDLISNTEKLLYNLCYYLSQQNDDGITIKDIKKIAGATIYKGIPIVGDGTTEYDTKPVLTKLDKDSEIKKLAEITEIKKLTELTEIKKLTEVTEIQKLSEITLLKKLNEIGLISEVTLVGGLSALSTDLSNINTSLGSIDSSIDDVADAITQNP